MNRDDAFEWFGGTADIKYAVAVERRRRQLRLDRSAGPGRGQFVAVTQRGDDADNGIEADNNEFNNNLLPRSNPQIYNITLCGDPDRNEGGESVRAPQLPARHGVHDPQLPDHRVQDHRVPDRRTPPRIAQVDQRHARRWARACPGTSATTAAVHSSSVTAFITSGRFPNVRGATCDPGLSTTAARTTQTPNFQPSVVGHARRRPARADSAAQRRLLRGRHLHRRGAAGARPRTG